MSHPPPLSANLVVGPLLVSNTLSWALWGVLSTQLAFFLRDIRAIRPTRPPPPSTARSTRRTSRLFGPGHGYEEFEKQQQLSHNTGFGFWFRGRRKKSRNESRSTFADAIDDDINPWRKSFVPPPTPPPLASISAFPSPSHIHNHARQRSGKSVPSSSDPYSPTAVHPSPLDTDSHSIFPSSAVPLELPSVYLLLLLYALYVCICVRTVLGTVQFWRVAVHLWGIGPSDLGPRWVGIVLADVIGPLIFAMTASYFIYVLYFSPSSYESTTKRRSALRPLSLLKNKTSANVLPEPYSFPFPQSPSSSVAQSNPHQTPHRHSRHQQYHQTQSRPWRRWFPFLQTKPSTMTTYAIIEPALLALLTLVVTICGFINCARSFKERPLGEPMKLDAVSLIWLAGMFALDLVFCILLCRALGTRLTTGPWISRLLRVMGEAGGAQLVVALLALVLMVSWRGGKPRSTLTIVAPSILPAVYAITVFLHVSSSHRRRLRFGRRHSTTSLSASRVPSKSGVGSKFEDIEMGLRSASRGGISSVPPTRVDLASAAAGSTYSTTNSSVDGGAALRAQALAYGREREREREKEKEKEREKEKELMAEKEAAALGAGVRVHMDRDTHGESSNSTSNTTSNNSNTNTSALSVPGVGIGVPRSTGIAETVTSNAKAPSVRSGVSGALSLELPTFRKGKSLRGWRYGYSGYGYGDPMIMMDDESGSDLGSDEDEWDEELDVDSEELGGALGGVGGGNTGTWDYGFAKEEREREREKAATLLAAGGGSLNPNTNMGSINGNGNGNEGTRLSVLGRNAGPSRRWLGSTLPPGKHSSFPSRPSSWRRSYPHPLSQSTNADANADETNEDDDKLSMLSGTSTTRSRRRGRRSYYASHNSGYGPAYPQGSSGNNTKGKKAPRLLPRTPGTLPFPPPLPPHPNVPASLASLSTDSLYLSNAPPPSTPGSVLVISRTSPTEPSIAEESIDRAASVAATRASTGSMFSTFSYTYPHPHHHHHHPYEYAQYYGGVYYPRPVQLPDLDVDLAEGAGGDGTAGEGGGAGDSGNGREEDEEKEKEKEEEEARALGSLSPGGASPGGNTSGVGSLSRSGGRTESRSPHPYSYSLTGGTNGGAEEEEAEQPAARRRWNVHPLKRIAEMGRLKF
ncbi:hypothetical protein ACEPAI_2514 [Sanghuangporus weigelae]